MEEIKAEITALQAELKEYLELRLELIQLNVLDHGTNAGARLMAALFFALAALGVALFIGIGAAFWIGDLIDHTPGGFLVVGGFGLLIILIFAVFNRSLIINPIRYILLKWMIRKKV